MMLQLMLKDLEQNIRPLGIFLAAVCLTSVLLALQQGGGGSAEAYLGFMTALIVFGSGLVLPMLFIGDERAKGTFRFLAILPIGPGMIARAKFILIMGIMVAVTLTALVVIPWVLLQSGVGVPVASVVTVLLLVSASLFSTAIGASLFFALSYKLASQLAYLFLAVLMVVPVIVMSSLEERGAASAVEASFSRPSVVGGVLSLAVVFVVLGVLFSTNTMKWRDWSDLGVDR